MGQQLRSKRFSKNEFRAYKLLCIKVAKKMYILEYNLHRCIQQIRILGGFKNSYFSLRK
jgi:hypothetical protein